MGKYRKEKCGDTWEKSSAPMQGYAMGKAPGGLAGSKVTLQVTKGHTWLGHQ